MRIKELRKLHKITQAKLASKIGVARSTISMYEVGASEPDIYILTKLSNYFNVSIDYLLGGAEDQATKGKLPVLGLIPAGIPIEAIEEIEGYIDINPKFSDASQYFALKVKGNSMSPRILDGDVVVVKKQDTAENGDICVVMVNGDDATLKTIKKEKEGLFLIPSNPAYDTLFFTNNEIQTKPVRIIGKVVELRANIN